MIHILVSLLFSMVATVPALAAAVTDGRLRGEDRPESPVETEFRYLTETWPCKH